MQLFYRKDGGAWTQYGGNLTTDTVTFVAPDGNGLYEFYSLATDTANNVEAAPAEADGYNGRREQLQRSARLCGLGSLGFTHRRELDRRSP